jgi:hypothetical protein
LHPLSSLASGEPARAPAWLAWAAGGGPLAFYLATASAYGGFYEEGAFIAAARSLGVTYPPGAPLSTLVSALFAQLPVGPLAFRASVSAAVCAAAALGLFARAVFFSLRGAGVRDAGRAALLALAAAWFVGQTPLFWQQAVRPNVFALQFLLSLIVVDALVRFELNEHNEDTRTLYFAAFVQGLCFANHHVFALLMLAPAAPTLGRVFARRGFIGLMGHVAFPILGFSAYAYVPIRASQQPAINFGDASTLPNLYWMLNEDPWWGPRELAPGSTWGQLSTGLGGAWVLSLLVMGALAALWFSLRLPVLRRFSVLWAIVLCVPFGSVALLIQPRLTADAWGALIPCALGLVALATLGLGLVLERAAALRGPQHAPQRWPALLLLFGTLLCWLWPRSQGVALPMAPDALDEVTRRTLPANAVLLTHDAGTVFRHLGAEVEEQLRRDVTLVPLDFLHVPGLLEQLVQSHPELRDLLREQLLTKRLALVPLQSLSERRPVLLELSGSVPVELYRTLALEGLFARVLPDAPAAAEARSTAARKPLPLRLSADEWDGKREDLLGRQLARSTVYGALLAKSYGDHETARTRLELGLRYGAEELRALAARVELELPQLR